MLTCVALVPRRGPGRWEAPRNHCWKDGMSGVFRPHGREPGICPFLASCSQAQPPVPAVRWRHRAGWPGRRVTSCTRRGSVPSRAWRAGDPCSLFPTSWLHGGGRWSPTWPPEKRRGQMSWLGGWPRGRAPAQEPKPRAACPGSAGRSCRALGAQH